LASTPILLKRLPSPPCRCFAAAISASYSYDMPPLYAPYDATLDFTIAVFSPRYAMPPPIDAYADWLPPAAVCFDAFSFAL